MHGETLYESVFSSTHNTVAALAADAVADSDDGVLYVVGGASPKYNICL